MYYWVCLDTLTWICPQHVAVTSCLNSSCWPHIPCRLKYKLVQYCVSDLSSDKKEEFSSTQGGIRDMIHVAFAPHRFQCKVEIGLELLMLLYSFLTYRNSPQQVGSTTCLSQITRLIHCTAHMHCTRPQLVLEVPELLLRAWVMTLLHRSGSEHASMTWLDKTQEKLITLLWHILFMFCHASSHSSKSPFAKWDKNQHQQNWASVQKVMRHFHSFSRRKANSTSVTTLKELINLHNTVCTSCHSRHPTSHCPIPLGINWSDSLPAVRSIVKQLPPYCCYQGVLHPMA